jgi:hypothetical protein
MEILKRAVPDGEMVPPSVSSEDLKDEVNLRTHRAGYTTRQGNPTYGTKIMGPGIGESKLNVWPKDENGNLIGD